MTVAAAGAIASAAFSEADLDPLELAALFFLRPGRRVERFRDRCTSPRRSAFRSSALFRSDRPGPHRTVRLPLRRFSTVMSSARHASSKECPFGHECMIRDLRWKAAMEHVG